MNKCNLLNKSAAERFNGSESRCLSEYFLMDGWVDLFVSFKIKGAETEAPFQASCSRAAKRARRRHPLGLIVSFLT